MGHEDENGIAYVTEETVASKAALVGAGGEEGIPEHVFRTENLCQWVSVEIDGPFPEEAIDSCTDDESEIDPSSPLVVSVDTSHDRSMSYVAVAGYREVGLPHIEVIAQRAGTEWVAKLVAQQLDFTPDAVVVQGRGAPASSLIEYIEQEGAEVTPCQGNDLTSSCSQFSDRVMNGSIRFREQESLRLALDNAVKKYLGEVWVWNRAKSPVDVAPLCAVTMALWGLEMLQDGGEVRVTGYGEGDGDWYQPVSKDNGRAFSGATSDSGRWWECRMSWFSEACGRLVASLQRFAQPAALKTTFMGREVDYAQHDMRAPRDPQNMTVEDLWATQPHLRTVIDFRARNIAQLGV